MVGLLLYLTLFLSSFSYATIEGYTIFTHIISELALSNISPFPYLFDFSCIIGGLTSAIFYYLLLKKFNTSQKFINFSRYTMLIGLIGSIGIISLDIFSLDQTGGICHGLSAVFAFGGYIISISGFSLRIYYHTIWANKMFVVNGILLIISLILYFILLSPLSEWIMLLSIIYTIIHLFYLVIFR